MTKCGKGITPRFARRYLEGGLHYSPVLAELVRYFFRLAHGNVVSFAGKKNPAPCGAGLYVRQRNYSSLRSSLSGGGLTLQSCTRCARPLFLSPSSRKRGFLRRQKKSRTLWCRNLCAARNYSSLRSSLSGGGAYITVLYSLRSSVIFFA